MRISPRQFLFCPLFAFVFALVIAVCGQVQAQQANWIWSPTSDASQQGAVCYFRKKFTLVKPEKAQLFVSAGDTYKIYINGRIAAEGESFGSTAEFDVSSNLQAGVNLIAVRVEHFNGAQTGLALRFRVKEKNETRWRSLISDSTWKTRTKEIETWKSTSLNDMGWLPANQVEVANIGLPQGSKSASTNPTTPDTAKKPVVAKQVAVPAARQIAPPQVTQAKVNEAKQAGEDRFTINKEFTVQQVMLDSETGSLVGMEFNEFGKLLLSKEGGALMIADLSRQLKDPNRIRVLCDEVNTCQGILPLNGEIFVTADGPEGVALYRLADKDRDGKMTVEQTLVKFTGELSEHGPHGLTLGGDGMLYINVGNGSQVQGEIAETSPHRYTYEGDVPPRYEDPGGHAMGTKAPGGTIVRVSLDGKTVERFAGGVRNSYDLIFDRRGELFLHDSDMEADMGMSWYRPTKIFHVTAGADLGWRSGWAKYPDYFLDQHPSVANTGRGSPAGGVLYQHFHFPARYHDSMFMADWSEGRILAVKATPEGAGYKVKTETFLSGRPLNVVDVAVGEDGALYFCTGGRGTNGGVYRVVWNGTIPKEMLKFDSELEKVIRHPQPNSAWARQNIAKIKIKMGDEAWNQAILGVATQTQNTIKYRTSAIDKMVLYGPFPDSKTLTAFANDEHAEIRAKAAQFCGLKPLSQHVDILQQLVRDSDVRVKRIAVESLMRLGQGVALVDLKPMLASTSRVESLIARRLLEHLPAEEWSDEVLGSEDIRTFMNGALSLLSVEPNLENSYRVLARCSEFMDGFVNDRDFVDLLRVVQLSLIQGKVDPTKIPAFANRIGNEFPSGNGVINRELSRVMCYMGIGSLDERITQYLEKGEDTPEDKLHVALYLQRVGENLSGEERLALINYLEQAHTRTGGGSYGFYLTRAIRDVAASMTIDQVKEILRNGDRWPNAAIAAFYKMPRELDEELLALIKETDQRAATKEGEAHSQLRLGVIAVLAQSGNPQAMEYLRELWTNEPERRSDISIGLAQEPDGPNWAYLISSLPVLDDMTNLEVLDKLATVNRKPRDPVYYRAVIELGYRLRGQGANKAAALLEHWTGRSIEVTNTNDWATMIESWRVWFQNEFPNEPELILKSDEKQGNYSTDQVLSFLEKNGLGDPVHGQQVFMGAQCANCHKMGNVGVASGPDLTSLAARFSNREMVDAIIHPSNVVSDQYFSKKILTKDGETFVGMTTQDSDGSWLVMQADGKRVRVEEDSVEEMKTTEISSMPPQLLDNYSLKDVSDLIAFLNGVERQADASTDEIK